MGSAEPDRGGGGAFCMLRREALDRVGLLDEDFFMYGEDIDLSYRMLKGGYHNYFLPLDILHYKGEDARNPVSAMCMSFMRRCSSSSVIVFGYVLL